jgi:hypothetical protein
LAAEPTRRTVLAAAAAGTPLLLAACRGVQVLGSPPPPAHDVAVLRSAIAAERAMVARYRAALAETGQAGHQATAILEGILSEHQQHAAQLAARLVVPAGGTSPAPLRVPAAGPIPSGRAAMTGALAAAEQEATARLSGQLLSVPPSLAQLMASIAASEATHVPVLHALGRPQ